MVFNPQKNYRTFRRYQQIAVTVGRFGFGELVGRLNLLGHLQLKKEALTPEETAQSRAVRFRLMLEQLGPTFIKLGQVLSTRPDMLPPDMIKELANLQNAVTPMPWSEIKESLDKHLGANFERHFREFDTEPIASASIAQVYRATLIDGRKVAVKVMRPGTEQIFQDDVTILEQVVGLIEARIEEARFWDLDGIVKQFQASVNNELDLRHEGRNADIFRNHFAKDDTVYVPEIVWEHSNRYVLVMEFVEGKPIDAYFGPDIDRDQRKELARRAATAVLKQVYTHGFFHADPHPRNTFVLEGNVICFLDFGMFGRLDEKSLDIFARALHAIVKKDTERLIRAAAELRLIPDEVDRMELRMAVLDMMEQYHGLPLKQISVPKLFRDIMGLVGRFRLQFRPDFLFLIKSLSTIESSVAKLDADFDLIAHTEPFVRKLVLNRYRPGKLMGDAQRFADDFALLASESPEHVRDILQKVRAGKLKLELQHTGLEEPIAQMNQMSDKVVLAIITAALTISSALLASSGFGPTIGGFPVIGGVGFVISGIAGIITVIDILHSQRKGR